MAMCPHLHAKPVVFEFPDGSTVLYDGKTIPPDAVATLSWCPTCRMVIRTEGKR